MFKTLLLAATLYTGDFPSGPPVGEKLPDIVLMDLVMPRLNGAEATRRIMRESPCPILVVTSTVNGHFDLVYQAMGAGALDAVETPVLVDRDFGGQPRKMLIQSSRNGYFFVLDRTNGKNLLTVPFGPVNWASGLDAKGQPIPKPEKEPAPDGRLIAWSADKGEKLLEIPTGMSQGMGPPITFLVDGKQYIALMGGTGKVIPSVGLPPPPPSSVAPGLPKLLTFVLDGAPIPNQ